MHLSGTFSIRGRTCIQVDAWSLRFQILYVGIELSRKSILPEKEGTLGLHRGLFSYLIFLYENSFSCAGEDQPERKGFLSDQSPIHRVWQSSQNNFICSGGISSHFCGLWFLNDTKVWGMQIILKPHLLFEIVSIIYNILCLLVWVELNDFYSLVKWEG